MKNKESKKKTKQQRLGLGSLDKCCGDFLEKGSNVPVGLDGRQTEEEEEEERGRGIFSRFVIRHSTKNVHGNYKQTSQ